MRGSYRWTYRSQVKPTRQLTKWPEGVTIDLDGVFIAEPHGETQTLVVSYEGNERVINVEYDRFTDYMIKGGNDNDSSDATDESTEAPTVDQENASGQSEPGN